MARQGSMNLPPCQLLGAALSNMCFPPPRGKPVPHFSAYLLFLTLHFPAWISEPKTLDIVHLKDRSSLFWGGNASPNPIQGGCFFHTLASNSNPLSHQSCAAIPPSFSAIASSSYCLQIRVPAVSHLHYWLFTR